MSHEGSILSTSSKSIILIELLTRRKWVSLKSLTLKDPKGELSKYDKKSVRLIAYLSLVSKKMMNRLFLSRLLHPKLFPSIVSERLSNVLARIDTSNISAFELVKQLSYVIIYITNAAGI
jgi:hypothetical protein